MLLDNKEILLDNKAALSDNRTILLDIHRNVLAGQEGTDGQLVRHFTLRSTTNTDRFSDSSQVSGCEH